MNLNIAADDKKFSPDITARDLQRVYKRFDCSTPDEVRASLKEHGVAVVPRVLPPGDTTKAVDEMWQFLEDTSADFAIPIKRDDPASWITYFNEYLPSHGMLLQFFGVGHSEVCWNIRQHPAVVQQFANLWQCAPEKLITSFDGMSISFPPEAVHGRGSDKGNGWLHTDQSFTRNGYECVQGFVNLFDVHPGDATLTLLSGSHKLHGECGKKFKLTDSKDWFAISPEQTQFYKENGCEEVFVQCDASSLVLWDSRTIHSGAQPLSKRPNPETMRCVVYVCMTPRGDISTKGLKKRISIYEKRRMTTHWPRKALMFGAHPRTWGKALQPKRVTKTPPLTALGKKLVGY